MAKTHMIAPETPWRRARKLVTFCGKGPQVTTDPALATCKKCLSLVAEERRPRP